MEKSKTAEEMRERLLSLRPDLRDDLAKISDLELLQLMAGIYKRAVDIQEAELIEIEKQLDKAARAIFSPKPH